MTRRVVSVLGIIVFHTCGYKSEAIMAFGASRNREKKGQNKKKTKEGKNLWQLTVGDAIFGKCLGHAEIFSYEDIKFVSISTLVAAVIRYFVSISLFVVHTFLVSFLTVSFSSFVYAHTLLI